MFFTFSNEQIKRSINILATPICVTLFRSKGFVAIIKSNLRVVQFNEQCPSDPKRPYADWGTQKQKKEYHRMQ